MPMIDDPLVAETLTLTQGASKCDLLPRLGGSIAAWSVRGQEMMRPTNGADIAARDSFAAAGFPLVPFSNRVNAGRFEWNDRVFSLAANFPPEPHAIHGVGFERAWQVQAQAEDSLIMTLMHRPGASWPWAFKAEQRLVLERGQLTLELRAVNLSDQPVPLAFGHHPYF